MRLRKEILLDIINLNGDVKQLANELRQYVWDSEITVGKINRNDISAILFRFRAGDLTFQEIEEWANVLEMRDDIEFEDDFTQELIVKLANPSLYELDAKKLEDLMVEIEHREK